MSTVTEQILDLDRQNHAEDDRENEAIQNRLRQTYIALLIEAVLDPAGVDQLRLLDAKNEAEVGDADFLQDSKAVARYFDLRALDAGKAGASASTPPLSKRE